MHISDYFLLRSTIDDALNQLKVVRRGQNLHATLISHLIHVPSTFHNIPSSKKGFAFKEN